MTAVCVAIVQRKLARKLPAFTAFMFAATAQQVLVGGYLLATADKYGYTQIQSFLSPLFGVLQSCASLEAYAWLVMSLVNFKRIGLVVLVVLAIGSVGVEIVFRSPDADANRTVAWLEAVERSVSYALALILIASLLFFKLIGGTPGSPRWHAGSLALLAAGNAIGWQLLSAYVVMGSCVAAFGFWCLAVHVGPSWEPIAAQPYDAEGVERCWREAERKIDDSMAALD